MAKEEFQKINEEKQIQTKIKMENRFYSRNKETKDNWETPDYFFRLIENRIDRWLNIPNFTFNLDPCASQENAKCKKYFTIKENGLIQNWKRHNVFVNPPYSEIDKWIKKCYEEGQKIETIVVAIIPSRTSTIYWHKYIMRAYELWFPKGRVNFLMNGKLPKNSSTFDLSIVIFRRSSRITPQVRSFLHKEKDLMKTKFKKLI